MEKVLVILGHPNINNSKVTKVVFSLMQKDKKYEIRDLYFLYPHFNIDVKKEQKYLLLAEKIVFLSPVHWYGMTPIMHQYIESVIEYGFAYGSQFALENKRFYFLTSTGSMQKDYTKKGYKHAGLEDFFLSYYEIIRYIRGKNCGHINNYGAHPEEETRLFEKIDTLVSKE